MSLHTWDFWATQLSVVSKAALFFRNIWMLYIFFEIQTVVSLNRLHKVPKLFESHQPQQTASITGHVQCIAKKKKKRT